MKKAEIKEAKVPNDLKKALSSSPKVGALWNDLTPIARRDFISWIEGAKQEETRRRRIKVTCSKLASGKRRPCCYAIVPMNLYKALGKNPKAKATWSTLTPNEKRDFSDWVEQAAGPLEKEKRVEEACSLLTSGKNQP